MLWGFLFVFGFVFKLEEEILLSTKQKPRVLVRSYIFSDSETYNAVDVDTAIY